MDMPMYEEVVKNLMKDPRYRIIETIPEFQDSRASEEKSDEFEKARVLKLQELQVKEREDQEKIENQENAKALEAYLAYRNKQLADFLPKVPLSLAGMRYEVAVENDAIDYFKNTYGLDKENTDPNAGAKFLQVEQALKDKMLETTDRLNDVAKNEQLLKDNPTEYLNNYREELVKAQTVEQPEPELQKSVETSTEILKVDQQASEVNAKSLSDAELYQTAMADLQKENLQLQETMKHCQHKLHHLQAAEEHVVHTFGTEKDKETLEVKRAEEKTNHGLTKETLDATKQQLKETPTTATSAVSTTATAAK